MLSTHSPLHAPRHVCLMVIDDVNVRGRASSRTEEKGGGGGGDRVLNQFWGRGEPLKV